MNKTIEITLDEHCLQFIKENSVNGKSPNELMHEAIILLQKKKAEEQLATELQKGLDSGFVENWNFDEWLKHKNEHFEAKS